MTSLKEFALFWPTGDKEQRRTFSLQTRCVTALYERLFPGFKTESCWKVLLECVDQVTKKQYRDLLGVYTLEVVADVEGFFSLSDTEKKKWTWRTLCAGIDELLEQTGWQREPFLEVCQKVQDLNFVNRWIWKKPVFSPSQEYTAELLIEHEVQFCNISVVVYDGHRQEIKRQTLISETPDEWAYAHHLGALSWESNERIILRNKDNNRSWVLDI